MLSAPLRMRFLTVAKTADDRSNIVRSFDQGVCQPGSRPTDIDDGRG